MTHDDVAYFRRRHDEERYRAESCPSPAISKIHRQFADRYAAALRADAAPLGWSSTGSPVS